MRHALCVALDGSDRQWILGTARQLAATVGWLKIGLEAFTAHGPPIVRDLANSGCRVFLDVKLHDIPATVGAAAANCAASGAHMFNVHAAGGRTMLEAAVAGAARGGGPRRPKVIAVTLLTSIDEAVLAELGVAAAPAELVVRWALLAQSCGLDGVVASAQEAPLIRSACGTGFLIVTPGIRPSGTSTGDQRRVTTPAEAIAGGADILVIGRPITAAASPVEAARRVLEEIQPST